MNEPDRIWTRRCALSVRIVAKSEVILGRDLLAGELEICCEIPASIVKHRIAGRLHHVKSGGLKGSMQHPPAVYLLESQTPTSFEDVDLTSARPCRALLA